MRPRCSSFRPDSQNAVVGSGFAQLQLVTNPAQRILPALVQQMLDVLVEAASTASACSASQSGRVVNRPSQGPADDADVGLDCCRSQSARLLTSGRAAAARISLSVTSRRRAPRRSTLVSFSRHAVHVVPVHRTGYEWRCLGRQREGTLRRGLTTPQSAGRLLLGKLLAALVLTTVVALTGLLAAVAWFGLAIR